MAIDPVCGMTVDPEKAAGRIEHGGKVYFFCGKGCVAKFQADPAKYVESPKPSVQAPAPHAAEYTCPMHPQILQAGPGSCPLCGMALEPRMPTAESDDTELRK